MLKCDGLATNEAAYVFFVNDGIIIDSRCFTNFRDYFFEIKLTVLGSLRI